MKKLLKMLAFGLILGATAFAMERDSRIGRLLHTAIWQNDGDSIKALLKEGMDVNGRYFDAGDATALFLAANLGRPEIVKLLIENGADITTRSSSGRTAIYAAMFADSNITKSIRFMLTTLSPQEKNEILNDATAQVLGIRGAKPSLPKDMERLITKEYIIPRVVDEFVQKKMMRNKNLMNMKDLKGITPDAWAKERGVEYYIKDFNFDDPKNVEALRNEIRENAMKVLVKQ